MADGRTLANRYELGELLGRGGMAAVYAATDRVLERPVAVKVLAPQFAEDEEFVERFRREARASAGLNHPNVVSVFDTGSDDGVHFIVMELVRGRTLAEVLATTQALPPERAAAIAASVAQALDAAHAQGLVHRDIKPGNVLITDAGQVKVTDFGIARAASGSSITMTGTILGTASYLSPEQAQGGTVDARSDIYSLGCVLYEMLAGRTPFAGESPVAIATQHVADDPPPPSSLRENVPPELEAVALRAMAKDPAARFSTAAEMGIALAGSVSGEMTQGLPVVEDADATRVISRPDRTAVLPPVEPAPVPHERPWWPWALAALGLALIGFLVARALFADPATLGRPSIPVPTTAKTTVPPEDVIQTVDEAHEALLATIEQGVAAGALDDELADELVSRIDDAVAHHEKGEGVEAQTELIEARQLVAAAGVEDAIVDTWEAQINDGITTLERAMARDPVVPAPEDDEDEGDDGKGKGNGKGKGKDGEGGG